MSKRHISYHIVHVHGHPVLAKKPISVFIAKTNNRIPIVFLQFIVPVKYYLKQNLYFKCKSEKFRNNVTVGNKILHHYVLLIG